MAKPTYAKLKLTIDTSVEKIQWGDQEIEVKKYLPIEDKLKMVTEILGLTADDNRFYNIGRLTVFKNLKILDYYTNLSITDKQKENPGKLYDEIVSSGFLDKIIVSIPEEELEEFNYILNDTIEQVYKYQNSAYGIMEAVSTDYNNLDFDIEKLKENLGNKENVEFLNKVLTKMG